MNYPRVGIGVLIFNQQQHLLLGKRQKAHGAFTWGPPGGHLEFGESFVAGGAREVKEEVGLNLSSLQFLTITNDIFHEEQKHYVSIFLRATLPHDQVVQNLEPEKVSTWEWFDLARLPENIFLPLKNLINTCGLDFLQK